MRTSFLLALSLLAASATLAPAAGLNLRWSACASDGGVQNRAFACNTNTGSHELMLSFVPPEQLPGVFAFDLSVDVATASTTLPAWWQFDYAGSCRTVSLSFGRHDGPGCPALFGSANAVAIHRYTSLAKPTGWGRMEGDLRVLGADATTLAPLQEYGLGRFVIANGKTVGTGACDGCGTPACIVFNTLRVHWNPYQVTTSVYTAEHAPGSNYVTWQGGGGTNCPAATPTRNSTWGAVKSLYR